MKDIKTLRWTPVKDNRLYEGNHKIKLRRKDHCLRESINGSLQ